MYNGFYWVSFIDYCSVFNCALACFAVIYSVRVHQIFLFFLPPPDTHTYVYVCVLGQHICLYICLGLSCCIAMQGCFLPFFLSDLVARSFGPSFPSPLPTYICGEGGRKQPKRLALQAELPLYTKELCQTSVFPLPPSALRLHPPPHTHTHLCVCMCVGGVRAPYYVYIYVYIYI